MSSRHNAVRAGTIAKVVALSLFLGGSGVGYVFQKGQIHGLAEQRKKNEFALGKLEQNLTELKLKLENVTSEEQLGRNLQKFRIQLVKPDPRGVITLNEPSLGPARVLKLVDK